MPTPEAAQAVADAGGWAAFLLLVALIGFGAVKRWWVPGWLYDQERDDREKAEVQLDRNTKAIQALTAAIRQLKPDGQPRMVRDREAG